VGAKKGVRIMKIRKKIALVVFSIFILISFFFAFLYLFMPQFMPYHADAVKMQWDAVAKEFQILILALMRTCGGGWLATAIGMSFILFIPFRKDLRWANLALLLVGLTAAVPSLIATLLVQFNTTASPPWIVAAISIVLVIIGFFLAL
jgi:hypothetical protein